MGWLLGQEKVSIVLILSVFGNTLNIILDYVLIVQFGYGSFGAGISYATSQYITLFLALVFACVDWKFLELKTAFSNIFNFDDFKSTLLFNGNLFLNNLVLFFVFGMFSYLGVGLGSITYAENALLLQVITINLFIADALKLSFETVGGTFRGEGKSEKLYPLLKLALGSGTVISIFISLYSFLFPKTLFSIFTNHNEVTTSIDMYIPWLIIVLVSSTIAYILIGYFIVLEDGKIVRDSSMISAIFGVLPVTFTMFWFYNNHVLWLSLSMFFLLRITMLVFKVDSQIATKDWSLD
jgi:MATE family multidrug resistance protein